MRFTLRQLVIALLLIGVATYLVAIPLTEPMRLRWKGRQDAIARWPSDGALIEKLRVEPLSGKYWLTEHVDRETGLMLEMKSSPYYREGFNQQMRELIAENGLPENSFKPLLPDKDSLLAMFHSDEYQSVDSFPYPATPTLLLRRDGSAFSVESNPTDPKDRSVVGLVIETGPWAFNIWIS